MSSDDLADFMVHEVTVETYVKTTGAGAKVYAAAVTVPGFLSRKQRLIRGEDGETVASSSTFSADIAYVDVLTARSKVTAYGQATTILTAAVSTGGAVIEGIDRVKAYLQ